MRTPAHQAKIVLVVAIVFLLLPVAASNQEDAATDAVASAFLQAREAAHLSKISRIGKNAFRKQARGDLHFPTELILDVIYRTTDPSTLPESARQLAVRPDSNRITARFAVGVCVVQNSPATPPQYSVVIATYESRWTSFWRRFQE